MATTKKAPAVKAKSAGSTVKVALLGFGTVGSSVAKLLAASKFPGIQLTHIYNRDVERKRTSAAAKVVPASVVWTEKIDDVLTSDVDVVVELMGGLNPVEGWLRKALASGKSVVTANKQLIAYRGTGLAKLAEKHGVQLIHGAAVAGGVPVITGMQQGLSGDQTIRLSGIVNGTCNYILSRMETGADYATVLADAQQLGYAEANPSADVDGYDARAKLCILSRIALRAELDPDAVATQSISPVEAIDFTYAKGPELHDSSGFAGAVGWDRSACARGAYAGAADFAAGLVAWDAEYGRGEWPIWWGCCFFGAWGRGGAYGCGCDLGPVGGGPVL